MGGGHPLPLAQCVGQHHGQDDGGRLHQRHGGGHVAAIGHGLRFEILRRRHKRHRADRAIGGCHRRGVEARQHSPQQRVTHQGHHHGQQHRQPQAAGHAGGESRGSQRKAALQAQCHQQVNRQELRDGRRHFQVRPHQARKHAQRKKKDRRVQQTLHFSTPKG